MIFGCILLQLMAFGFAGALLMKVRFEQMLPLACSLIILVLYVCGLAGLLAFGVPILVGLSVLCAAFCIYWLYKHPAERKKAVLGYLCTPGLVAFLVFVAAIYVYDIGRLLSEWDEFTHWGLVVKNMANLDALGNTPGATTYFLDYPPSAALFLYFFQAFYPAFNESYLMIAQAVLSVSFLLPVFAEVSWQRWKALFFLLPLCAFLPMAFYPTFFSTLYVDALLGLQFAYLLYLYFSAPRLSGFLLFQLSVGSAVLCLTKPSGLGLAGIALALIALDLLLHGKKQAAQYLSARGSGARLWGRCLCLGAPLFSLLAANLSWKLRLSALHIGPHFDTGEITLSGLFELFGGTAPGYRYQTLQAFNSRVFGLSESGFTVRSNSSVFFWILLALAVVAAFYFLCQNRAAFVRMRTVCLGLVVSFMLYALYLLLLYLFTYSEAEAQNLASCDRYLYTFLLGMLTFFCFMLVHMGARLSAKPFYALCAGVLVLCLAVSPNSIRIPANLGEQKQATVTQRGRYAQAEKAASVLDRGACVYVISQNDPTLGLDYFTLRYVMTPAQVQQRGEGQSWRDVSYSLGAPYHENDTQTRDISAEDWARELAAMYTHVYLLHPDEPFIQRYGSLFEDPAAIADNTLFAVQPTADGVVLTQVPYDQIQP